MSLSDFKILTKLGSGAYSSVYKVQRVLDGEVYALKKVNILGMNQKQKQNALNQIRILASIRHQNVIGYREAFLDENTKSLCIIMEFADNGDLYQKIIQKQEKKQGFSQTEIWKVFIQIVRGLKCLHDRKIMHRDLKSANVFVYKNGKAKLGDLNVSKITEKGLCQTQTGTPYYASPQVWKDEAYGPKSDIWSLGCVIYQMMALKPPFQAEDMEGLYKKVTKGQYSQMPLTYSADLNNLIRILLQTDPFKRPTCEKILALKMVTKRINEQNKEIQYENPQFLQTIRMPKDIYFLTQNLPKPNYFIPKTLTHQDRTLYNKTQKMRKKNLEVPKNWSILPKLNRIKKQNSKSNILSLKSELKSELKSAQIIGAARSQLNKNQNIQERVKNSNNINKSCDYKNAYNKDYIQLNKHINQMKIRQKVHKKQKIMDFSMPSITKDKKTIDMEAKIQSLNKIYRNNIKKK